MSNIFKEFVLSRPVKANLVFGHNENIVIEAVDFTERKKKGIAVGANTYIKLTKVEAEDRSVVASTEISFWNLDPTKDFIYDNFITQFSILCGIIEATGGSVEQYEADVLGVVEGADDNEISIFLKKAANSKLAQAALVDGFKAQIEGKTGLNSALLKCKMVSNKSGFLQPANDLMWILPMSSEIKLPEISAKELRTYKKALETDNKKATPDAAGAAPAATGGEAAVSASSLASI